MNWCRDALDIQYMERDSDDVVNRSSTILVFYDTFTELNIRIFSRLPCFRRFNEMLLQLTRSFIPCHLTLWRFDIVRVRHRWQQGSIIYGIHLRSTVFSRVLVLCENGNQVENYYSQTIFSPFFCMYVSIFIHLSFDLRPLQFGID